MSMKLKKKVKELTGDDATQASQITALQTAVGDDKSGLVKDMTDAKAAIGASDSTAGSLKKRCKDIEDAIGDAETSGTILYRLAQLEKE